MDTAYLKEHVGRALTLGLTEIAQKKPVDPIEYLSKWLRKHVENLKDEADVFLSFICLLTLLFSTLPPTHTFQVQILYRLSRIFKLKCEI